MMVREAEDILVIGFGNPGRLDDGLGPAFAEAIQRLQLPGVTVASDYQLTVEDASDVAQHKAVIFADAAVTGPEPFELRCIESTNTISFSTHSVEPQEVLGLASQLFDARTVGYVLAIRGYEFDEFGMELSEKAQNNLDAALDFIKTKLAKEAWWETDRQVQHA